MTVVPQHCSQSAPDIRSCEPAWGRSGGQLKRGGLAMAVSLGIHAVLAVLLASVLVQPPKEPSRDRALTIEVSLIAPPAPAAPAAVPAPPPDQPASPAETPAAIPAAPAPAAKPKPKPQPARAAKPKPAPEPDLQEFKDDFAELARDFSDGGTPLTSSSRSASGTAVALMGSRRATVLGSTDFPYPRHAAEQGIEGTVEVRISVAPDGSFDGAQVIRSSGYGELDDAVLEAVQNWRYQAAVRNGMPVASVVNHVVRFTGDGVIVR